MSKILEFLQTYQRTVAGGDHLFDRVRVFESGAGDHADDRRVGSESSIASGSQRSGECHGTGRFGEDAFCKSEAALSVPDFFIGDDVLSQTVFNDQYVDRLTGNAGADWFLANTSNDSAGDVVIDIIADLGSSDMAGDTDT